MCEREREKKVVKSERQPKNRDEREGETLKIERDIKKYREKDGRR